MSLRLPPPVRPEASSPALVIHAYGHLVRQPADGPPQPPTSGPPTGGPPPREKLSLVQKKKTAGKGSKSLMTKPNSVAYTTIPFLLLEVPLLSFCRFCLSASAFFHATCTEVRDRHGRPLLQLRPPHFITTIRRHPGVCCALYKESSRYLLFFITFIDLFEPSPIATGAFFR